MATVATKLENALKALLKEGKKISPYAVERRAGVSNGSLKNHIVLLEKVLAEKEKYATDPTNVGVVKAEANKAKAKVSKDKYQEILGKNEKLRAENEQLKGELKVMADKVAQMTWELHRYKTKTRKDSTNVHNLKA